jgi:hypothetical protein
MQEIKPYTYKITNSITGYWYIGKKTANKVPAGEDITYWGSSKYLKELMEEIPEGWTKEIIAEYESDDETGLAEEELLEKYWSEPGRVNRAKRNGRNIDYSDPEVRAKFLEATRAAHARPEHRAKRSEIMKNQRATESEEIKQKRAEATAVAHKARAKIIIATNISTGEEFEMQGNKEMKEYKFNHGNVSQCLNRKGHKSNIYKGYTFRYKV